MRYRTAGEQSPAREARPGRPATLRALLGWCVLLAIAAPGSAHAQRASDSLYRIAIDGAPSPASPLDLLLPSALRAGYLTRAWVRDSLPPSDMPPSDMPASGMTPAGGAPDDLARMDMIYLRALGEAEGDVSDALFAALVASFEHRTIPLSFGLALPLTFEPGEAFDRRVALLPRRLFADNPAGDDRDKLQHFFASAWLAWTLDNAQLADLIGLGIEAGEQAFVSGGADDPRDVRANRLGQMFAGLLHRRPHALPSIMFRAWNKRWKKAVNEE